MNETCKCMEAVAKFNRHIGVVADPASPAQAALRTRLILEEYAETYAALQEGDIIEAADGLADLRYVVLGAAVVYGVMVPDRPLDDDVCGGAVLGPEMTLGFGRLPLNDVVRDMLPPVKARHLEESLRRFDAALGSYARLIGVPLNKVFWEVHRSNMTKNARGAGTGSKYGDTTGTKHGGTSAKGPGYSPPDIAGALGLSEVAR